MGSEAFAACTGLQQIIIKDGCSVIASKCFNGCNNIQTITSYCEELPTTATNAFSSYTAALYVPKAVIGLYQANEPWSKFRTIGTIEGGVPEPDNKKCAVPEITYEGGQLRLNSATEDVAFVTEITDTDVKTYDSNIIDLSVTYTITAYATKSGYENSDVVTATLCWIDATPTTNDGSITVDMAEVKAIPVLIKSHAGVLTVDGSEEGTTIAVYDLNGRMLGSTTADGTPASIATNLQRGNIAIVRIGQRSVKVRLQ